MHIVAVRHEAKFHAVRLFRDGKIYAAGQSAHFVLGQFAERKFASRELLLRQAPQKIRLIFGFIKCAQQFPATRFFILADARVVAGGQAFGTDLARHAQKRLELHVRVAIRACDGRAAGEILVHKRTHHARLKLFLEIHDIMRKIQMTRNGFRVVDIVERAAAMLCRGIALQFGQAALVPELHREADDGAPLLLQKRRDRRGIDAAGHGDGDEAALRFRALGKRVELGGRIHRHKFIVADSASTCGRS